MTKRQNQLEVLAFVWYCKKFNIRNFTTVRKFWKTTNKWGTDFLSYAKTNGLHNVFDVSVNWWGTAEGHEYWYRHSLQFVVLLIIIGKKYSIDISSYITCLGSFLSSYWYENYENYDWWKQCNNFYSKITTRDVSDIF